MHVRRDEDGRIVRAGGVNGEDQEVDTQAAAEAALLHLSSPRDAATIAVFLRTRVYRPESLVWLEGHHTLLRSRRAKEIIGPYDVKVQVGSRRTSRLAPGAPAEEGATGGGAGGTAQVTGGRAEGRDGLGAG